MHFCDDAARVYARFSRPRKTSLNWFIPALVKSSDGSSCGTSDELATTRCPFRSKYSRNDARISLQVIGAHYFTVELTASIFSGWPPRRLRRRSPGVRGRRESFGARGDLSDVRGCRAGESRAFCRAEPP